MDEIKAELLKAALAYRSLNKSIIPVGSNKKPLVAWTEFQNRLPDEEEIKLWFEKYSVQGIAIITGPLSDLVVVDTEAEADLTGLDFGSTVEAASGGGGRHFYYKYPENYKINNRARIHPKIDIRGEGGYIIAPPSLHPSGGRYKWIKSLEEHKPVEVPNWLYKELTQIPNKKPLCINKVPQGRRNDTATRYIGNLLTQYNQDQWDITVWDIFKNWNSSNVNPPLDEKELRTIFNSITSKEANNLENESKEPKDTMATLLIKSLENENATLFHDQHGEPYIHINSGERWINLLIKSDDFKHWLCRLYYQNYNKALGSQPLNDAINLISAKAKFDGEKIHLENRITQKNDTIWYSLGDKKGRILHFGKNLAFILISHLSSLSLHSIHQKRKACRRILGFYSCFL